VPVALQGRILRRTPTAAGALEGMHRFGAIAWEHTVAYSEELDYHPSIWLNLRGREPQGIVEPADYEATRARVTDALRAWRDQQGRAVVTRVWRREELYAGPHVERAPDLLLELANVDRYSPSCLRSPGPGPALRRLSPSEHGAGKGSGMNGAHRRDGLFVLAGPGVRTAGQLQAADIVDVLPTLLALTGVPVPAGLDGHPIQAALTIAPSFAPEAARACGGRPRPYPESEEGDIAARLMALGYLEPRT